VNFLAFAAACALVSVYGFLQGAFPFGVVEAIWSAVAVYRWRKALSGLIHRTMRYHGKGNFCWRPSVARPVNHPSRFSICTDWHRDIY